METRNAQKLSVPENPELGRLKWTSPIIVTIKSEKSEVGATSGAEGGHSPTSTLKNS